MPRSVRIDFDDGTSHTYDNVPDDVTDDQVQSRAQTDFSKRTISGVSAGQAPEPKEPTPGAGPVAPEQKTSLIEDIAGPVVAAGQIAAEHPVATGAALTGAGTLLSKIPGVGTMLGKAGEAVVPQSIRTMAGAIPEGLANWARGIGASELSTLKDLQHQALQYTKMGQPVPQSTQQQIQFLEQKLYQNLPKTPPTQAGQQAFNQMANQLGGGPKPVAPTGAPATGPVAPQGVAQGGQSMAQRVAQSAWQRVLPAAGTAAGLTAVVAGVPSAMAAHDYKYWKQLSEEERKRQAMEALSGQAPGQAW